MEPKPKDDLESTKVQNVTNINRLHKKEQKEEERKRRRIQDRWWFKSYGKDENKDNEEVKTSGQSTGANSLIFDPRKMGNECPNIEQDTSHQNISPSPQLMTSNKSYLLPSSSSTPINQLTATTAACVAAACITYPAEMYRLSFTSQVLASWDFESVIKSQQ